MTYDEIYAHAVAADNAFHAALRAQFGNDASDARYFRVAEFSPETAAAYTSSCAWRIVAELKGITQITHAMETGKTYI